MSERRERKKAAARSAVVAAAAQMFVERGFEATRIDAIAERADVAVGTVYNHFPTKPDLLRAVMLNDVEDVLERAAPLAATASGAPASAVAALTDVLVDVMERRPRQLWRDVLGYAMIDPRASLGRAYADVLARLRAVLIVAFEALSRDRALRRHSIDAAAGVAFAIAFTQIHAYVADDAVSAADTKRSIRRLMSQPSRD